MSDDIVDVNDETFLLKLSERVDHEVTEQGSGHLERWHADRLREIADKLKTRLEFDAGLKNGFEKL